MYSPFEKTAAASGQLAKPDGFNPYALGNKTYGGGRPMPNIGAVSAQGQAGYEMRDRQNAARKMAMQQRMQAANAGAYASANFLRGQ